MWVVEVFEDVDLILDSADEVAAVLADDFHGSDLVGGQVHDHEDLSAAATSNFLDLFVVLCVGQPVVHHEKVPETELEVLLPQGDLLGLACQACLHSTHVSSAT